MPFVRPLEERETFAARDAEGAAGSRSKRESAMSQFSFEIDPDSYAALVKRLGISRPALAHRRSADCTCPKLFVHYTDEVAAPPAPPPKPSPKPKPKPAAKAKAASAAAVKDDDDDDDDDEDEDEDEDEEEGGAPEPTRKRGRA